MPGAMANPIVKKVGIGAVALLVLIQLAPFGHDRTNPPVTGQPKWSDPETKATFDRACADCHSHQTKWPWYSYVAPVSWLVIHDVDEGRAHFNVDAWGPQGHNEGDEAAEEVEEGEMPLPIYLPMHPEAKLSDAERAAFAKGLAATFGGDEHGAEAGEEHEHEDEH